MRRVGTLILSVVLMGAMVTPAVADPPHDRNVRFATFNASLNRFNEGDLLAELEAAVAGDVSDQLAAVLAIIDHNDADVLLINEFDYDPEAAAIFAQLAGYRFHYVAPSNTGIPTGYDLNNDDTVGGPDDAFGFGFFPGQYGMLVLSRYRILDRRVRTFQKFLWADMPGARLPHYPDGAPWFGDEELEVVRLSSKSHWDVPIRIDRRTVHFLVSHPTPPVFDGEEDRNGLRNADEIRFWADYVLPDQSRYIYDDRGRSGGLSTGAWFVIAGDMNSDPYDGDSLPGATQQILLSPRVNTTLTPSSEGAVEASFLQDAENGSHIADSRFDTADFSEPPGNLRADYVLPSKALRMVDAGVFWPTQADPLSDLTGVYPFPSSDHRMVWVDVVVP